MLRVSKLTDYALLVMIELGKNPSMPMKASELASLTKLNQPTTAKILKVLASNSLVNSLRGCNGGYIIARDAENIPLTEIITAIDGPIAIAECFAKKDSCSFVKDCSLQTPWQQINELLNNVLNMVSLENLINKKQTKFKITVQ